MTMDAREVAALLAERDAYIARGLPLRVAQVDAALAAIGHHVDQPAIIETAADSQPVETAARRAGRPRKAD